jgi:hypothetical protein
MPSIGSAYIGKNIGEQRQKKTEETIKKIKEAIKRIDKSRRKSQALSGRESEESNFVEAPFVTQEKIYMV